MAEKKQKGKQIAVNRKARHDYFVDETYEAGIVLTGTEIKSIRLGKCNIKDSYIVFPTICHNEISEEASLKLYYYNTIFLFVNYFTSNSNLNL